MGALVPRPTVVFEADITFRGSRAVLFEAARLVAFFNVAAPSLSLSAASSPFPVRMGATVGADHALHSHARLGLTPGDKVQVSGGFWVGSGGLRWVRLDEWVWLG